ncbi:MAG: DUF1289 domain-containing protein [Pseudomonadota bacterium]
MTDDVWRRQEIESPCVKLCMLSPQSGICVGCFRTGEEIGRWSTYSPEQRQDIMAALPEREGLLAKRSGGRNARLKRQRSARRNQA